MAGAGMAGAGALWTEGLAKLTSALAGSAVGPAWRALFEAAEHTLVRVPALTAAGDAVAAAMGMQPGATMARLLVCFVLASPVGAIMPMLPSASLRHVYACVTGFLALQFVFGVGYLHVLLPSALIYATLALTRATGLLPGWRHWLCALVSFAYLIFRHLARGEVRSDSVDDSTLLMILVIKLYTISYNLFDAEPRARAAVERSVADARKAGNDKAAQAAEAIAADRAARSLDSLPSPLEFAGYVLNPTTVFVGPAFEVTEYLAAQRQVHGAAVLASRWLPGLWKLAQGAAWAAASAVFGGRFPVGRIYELALDARVPAWDIFTYSLGAVYFTKVGYYSAWKLTEAAAVLAGFGYRPAGSRGKANPFVADLEYILGWPAMRAALKGALTIRGVDAFGVGLPGGVPDWEGACNVNPLTNDTRISLAESIEAWNQHTQQWLKRYVFLRAPRAWSRALTFATSAFWHGFFPGYYMVFGTMFLHQETARAFMAALDAAFGYTDREAHGTLLAPKAGFASLRPVRALLWAAQWAVQTACTTYSMIALVLFLYTPTVTVWARLHWLGHLVPLAAYVVALLLPRPRRARGAAAAAAKGAKSS